MVLIHNSNVVTTLGLVFLLFASTSCVQGQWFGFRRVLFFGFFLLSCPVLFIRHQPLWLISKGGGINKSCLLLHALKEKGEVGAICDKTSW